jgi:hypothetical protein
LARDRKCGTDLIFKAFKKLFISHYCPFKLENGVFRSMKERQEQETQRLRRDLDAAQAAARTALTQAEQLRTQLSDLQVRLYSFPTNTYGIINVHHLYRVRTIN